MIFVSDFGKDKTNYKEDSYIINGIAWKGKKHTYRILS
jgi:hypothetical protein